MRPLRAAITALMRPEGRLRVVNNDLQWHNAMHIYLFQVKNGFNGDVCGSPFSWLVTSLVAMDLNAMMQAFDTRPPGGPSHSRKAIDTPPVRP